MNNELRNIFFLGYLFANISEKEKIRIATLPVNNLKEIEEK